MFIGHFAPALIAATHKDAPRLPVLFVGAQLVDWAFFAFLLTGTEKMRFQQGISAMNPMDLYHMPYTHSLLGAAIWALGFAALVWLATKNRTGALVAATVVLSHWFLDWLVHVPDLTFAGQPPKLGLGLWNYPMIEIPLELALIFGSLWYYARKRGAMGVPLWTIAILFAALQLFSW
ncbi:MAG: metal-dependent hydrolase, partial [Sphingorhabdus sp.]